jgi:hypothetical protein
MDPMSPPVGLKIKEKVMKKICLLFVSVVLAGVLITACSQPESPSSFDVTHVVPGAEGVAADKIKAESYDGFILVYWDKAVEAAGSGSGYTVWRRELDENRTPLDGTISNLGVGSFDTSPQRKIPFKKDENIKNGTFYQYGVSLESYKSGNSSNGEAKPKSEIVWQVIGETPATGKKVDTPVVAKTKDETSIAEVLDKIKATVTPYDEGNSSGTGEVNVKEKATVRIEGLTLGFYYRFYLESVNMSSPTAIDWSYVSSVGGTNYRESEGNILEHYLDTGSWDYQPVFNDVDLYLSDNHPSGFYNNWQGRIVVSVWSGKDGKYLQTTSPDYSKERLSSNEKVVTSPNATFGAY